MREALHPVLLWSGAVLLYGDWWRSRASGRAQSVRTISWVGSVVVLCGAVLAITAASGWAAGVASAIAHLTAAVTLTAVLVPLFPKPVATMSAVAVGGMILGVLEAWS